MTGDATGTGPRTRRPFALLRGPALWIFLATLALAWYVGAHVPPTLVVERLNLDVHREADGHFYYIYIAIKRAASTSRSNTGRPACIRSASRP